MISRAVSGCYWEYCAHSKFLCFLSFSVHLLENSGIFYNCQVDDSVRNYFYKMFITLNSILKFYHFNHILSLIHNVKKSYGLSYRKIKHIKWLKPGTENTFLKSESLCVSPPHTLSVPAFYLANDSWGSFPLSLDLVSASFSFQATPKS